MAPGQQTTSDHVRQTSLTRPPMPGSPGSEQRSPQLHISFIPLAYSSDDPEGSARRLVTALRPEWDDDNGGISGAGDPSCNPAAAEQHIEFVRFTEGITNTLLKAVLRRKGLSREDADRDAVLLRAYGHGSELIIDRLRETQNHELLMRYGLATELLARFDNGMMYRFISGTAAKPADLRRPPVYRAVAQRLAEWHAVVPCIPGKTGHGRRTSRSHSSVSSPTAPSATSLNSPIPSGPASMVTPPTTAPVRSPNSEPSLHRQTSGASAASAASTTTTVTVMVNPLSVENAEFQRRIDRAAPGKPSPNVWTVMQKWIFALPTVTDSQLTRREELQLEFNKLVVDLSQRPGLGNHGLVFAHCDLLSGNVILPPKPSSADVGEQGAPKEITVSFIDYEYATPSPAAFDISNHFAEWGGFDCDWSALPTRAQRREFIAEYIHAYFEHVRRNAAGPPPHPAPPATAIDEAAEVDRLMVEVDAFRGLPGFYWGVWALIQAEISEHDFNYAEYAETRLAEYWAWRDEESGRRAQEGREMPVREKRWAQEE